ncbi:Ubiquitin-like protein [Apiospora aurea]|uniref:Ubiquitin-like protein n=1 Tax=Apiospora aurea TaxID=335848 RepID=A0ABR1PUL4_9PEZI
MGAMPSFEPALRQTTSRARIPPGISAALFQSTNEDQMEITTEAIIAIVGVIVTLPPTFLLAWKLLCRRGHEKKRTRESPTVVALGDIQRLTPILAAVDDIDLPQHQPPFSAVAESPTGGQMEYLCAPAPFGNKARPSHGATGASVVISLQVRMGSDSSYR